MEWINAKCGLAADKWQMGGEMQMEMAANAINKQMAGGANAAINGGN